MDERNRNPDWKRAIETNRGIDEAVAHYEQALRADWHRLQDPARLRPVEDAPTRQAIRATGSFGATPLRPAAGLVAAPQSVPPSPAPPASIAPSAAPPRPVVVPMPPPAAGRNGAGGVPEHRVPVDAIASQITAAIDALRTRAAGAEAQVLADPWTGKPRPLFTDGDGENGVVRPNPYTDEEIRDRIQPHWRAVRTAAEETAAAREEAERAFAAANPFRRMGAARRALTAARAAEAEARQSSDALEAIWSGESMRRQFVHDRAVADEAFQRAMEAAVGAPDLDRRLAALEEEQAMTVRLIEHGVSVIGARPGETRAQALVRAVAALPVPPPSAVRESGSIPDDSSGPQPEAELEAVATPAP